jgi:hypothetical protein
VTAWRKNRKRVVSLRERRRYLVPALRKSCVSAKNNQQKYENFDPGGPIAPGQNRHRLITRYLDAAALANSVLMKM